ncbi:EAL domain-containing protein [Massilia sp. TS11]|uniref:bifunctional diguanylate cyclase/phosphodiesterase n=1 Tax=Massilia sp. TS11 TaxID=2908003 RepID=UPI001EDAFE9F|nr:EAL domain-containing protein [Massilia sp. TS11]MCG2585958.1 EAL domain-containing protein [Massilia sp. TS11]
MKRIRQLRHQLILALLLLVGATAAFASYTIWRLREEAIANGLEIAAMHARAFEDFLTQSLGVAELTAIGIATPDLDSDSTRLSQSLAEAVRAAPYLRSLSVLDASGRIVASSNPYNLGQRPALDAFLPQADPGRAVLRVGVPWQGRDFADGTPVDPARPLAPDGLNFLPLLRTVNSGGQSTRLLLAFNTDYLSNHVLQQLDTHTGSVDILRYDGILLASSGNLALGQRFTNQLAAMHLHQQNSGKLEGGHDPAAPALTAFRSSPRYPVLLVTHLERAPALRNWRKETNTLLLVLAPTLGLLVLLAIAYHRRQCEAARARFEAERQQAIHASVFTHAREAILITDANGTIIDVNDAFTRITGYSAAEAIGRNPSMLSSGRHDKAFYRRMWEHLLDHGFWHGEIWNRRKDGETYPEMLTIGAVAPDQGMAGHYVALFSDISHTKAHEQELEQIAHYDALTSLPNRVLLGDRLRQGMLHAQRSGHPLAVAFIDLDGFKQVNDSYGHDAGDALLVELATRMRQTLRAGDTLARLGGDEFVAVLFDLQDSASSLPRLQQLLTAVSQPFSHHGHLLKVTGSLGVSFYPQGEDVDADTLMRQADQAMYQAKLAGKNQVHVFDAAHDRDVRSQHASLAAIGAALRNGELVLHYQPKVNLRSGQVIGAEALLRWQHPEQGLLMPGAFLGVVENHALAIDIGEWVIRQALIQAVQWRAAGLHIPLSVNVGARQLQQPDFVTRLRALLASVPDARAADIELEILETSALEDLQGMSQVIQDCRQLGVRFALDDFGTGYSSLTYLKRLPVATLKVDQSFVRDMLDDPDDLAILEGVLGLAHAFHREVIAEGVETAEHSAMLLRLGCELAQGYGIARPMPGPALVAWAARWRPAPMWQTIPRAQRDDLPLLFAAVEHRAWVKALEQHLHGAGAAPPEPAHWHARVSEWLAARGLRQRDAASVRHFMQSHADLLALATELSDLHAQGRTMDALAGLEQLYSVRDTIHELACQLLDRRRSAPAVVTRLPTRSASSVAEEESSQRA